MANPETQSLQATQTQGIEKNPGGRPSTFNEATAFIICERLAGGETLSKVCKTPGIPARQTVNVWRRKHPSFDADYRTARLEQMEAWGDECVEIADDDTLDTMQGVDKQGNAIEVANHANVQRDRLRVEVRHRQMRTIAANVFGDKVSHEHSGEVTHTVELSDRERMRRLATFMVEDRAAGVLIEGQAVNGNEPSPMVAGAEAMPSVSNEPARTLQASPADIIQGRAIPTEDQTET